MEDVKRAVVRLTEHHTELIGEAVGESQPLLSLLREARYPNLGRTKSGGGNGDVLDVQAIALYEHIDGAVRAWLAEYRQPSEGDLLKLTRRLFEVITTEHAGGRLEDPDRMYGMFPTWVQRIDDHFDPPKEYELTAACPVCASERVPNSEGAMKWCVRVPVKVGRAVIPECHACGAMWAGRDELASLAEQMGVVVDWVALREIEAEKRMTPA